MPTPAQFLNSPDICQNLSQKAMDHSLNLGLSSRNHIVRVLSLKGLGSTLMHPYKVRGRSLREVPSAISEGYREDWAQRKCVDSARGGRESRTSPVGPAKLPHMGLLTGPLSLPS